jgi:hypothetical protein
MASAQPLEVKVLAIDQLASEGEEKPMPMKARGAFSSG